jgi:cyanate permease
MYTTTRNVLILLLVVMAGAMFYGFNLGVTPDSKAMLALMYGLGVGMGVCIALLVTLPAIDLARKARRQTDERRI